MDINSSLPIMRIVAMRHFIFVTLLLVMASCSPSRVEYRSLAMTAIEDAGVNAPELQSVIEHYQNVDRDAEKLEATYFLIAAMPNHYATLSTADSAIVASLPRLAVLPDPRGWDPVLSTTGRWIDSLYAATPMRLGYKSDLRNIKAEYLIENIDRSFECWRQSPWHDDYTFDEFCEWVLPYRTSDERLDNWRQQATEQRHELEDSVLKNGTLFDLGVLLINNTGIYYNIGMSRFPIPLTMSDMQSIKRGSCDHMAHYALKMFRSRGIPSALDVTPVWANRSSGHVWNAIVLPGGKSRDISYHPDGNNTLLYKLSKVYRRRFSPMRQDSLYAHLDDEPIPPFFSGGDMQDVTAEYDMPTSDVKVEGLSDSPHGHLAWLCTFNNSQWIPVAYTTIQRNRALFRDMARGVLPGANKAIEYIDQGPGILYLPAYYNGDRAVGAANPFLLYEDGTIRIITPDTTVLQSMILGRKYPKNPDFTLYERNMIGGRFEAANRRDFSDAVTLLEIKRAQAYPMERVALAAADGKTYRYVRYLAVDKSRGNVAEVMFYDDTTSLVGTPFGTTAGDVRRGPSAMVDGSLESYYHYEDSTGAWAGIDLGTPRSITCVAFSARTDDNEIRIGDLYELFYWNGDWCSAGRQRATEYRLTWEHVPSGAIYLLRNLNRGVEHRPFTYENQRQIWW